MRDAAVGAPRWTSTSPRIATDSAALRIDGRAAAGPKRTIASVGNPNMVRNEKDFEMIVIAQGQKQNFAWVAFALIPKIGALLFEERKLRWMTGLGIDSDRYVEIFDAS